jgi:RNA polymerase-binding protein
MRGTRLGASSLESDEGVQPAARQVIRYLCPAGHQNSGSPTQKPVKPARTHWDMLLERRTTAELEELLQERLGLLRSGALTQHRRSA